MKRLLFSRIGTALCGLLLSGLAAFGQGTAFNYQGRLFDTGLPANGIYDLTFTLYTTNITGVPVAPVVTDLAVPVNSGFVHRHDRFWQRVRGHHQLD